MTGALALLPWLALAACGGRLFGQGPGDDGADTGGEDSPPITDPDSFATAYAASLCAWYERCAWLDEVYGSATECLAIEEENVLAYVTQAACDFDVQAARDCAAEWEDASCDEVGMGWPADSACNLLCDESGGI